MKKLNVFLTINDAYAKYLAVAIVSIISNTSSDINFYIIDGGISEDSKRKLEKLKKIKDFYIEYLPINPMLFEKLPKSSQAHISKETNYRFLISSLKQNINKCIFLDADLVFNDDISKLWNIDVEGYYMAAVQDQAPLRENSWATKLPLPEGYVYVNTGVTVMNLKKWRKDCVEDKFFVNVERYSNLLKFPDQDILNITLAPYVKYIPHVFNAMPVQAYLNKEQEDEAFFNPIVFHYAGSRKPWLYPDCKYADIFWKYARMTPFYEEILKRMIPVQKSHIGQVHFEQYARDSILFPMLYWQYARCRLLSHMSWGKTKQHYKMKKETYHRRIQYVRAWLHYPNTK